MGNKVSQEVEESIISEINFALRFFENVLVEKKINTFEMECESKNYMFVKFSLDNDRIFDLLKQQFHTKMISDNKAIISLKN